MKNFLMFVLALVIVWIVWSIIGTIVSNVFHIALIIGMIALFCWLVAQVYQALTKQKI